jgi:DNA-binding GntR family transcriptional regulator
MGDVAVDLFGRADNDSRAAGLKSRISDQVYALIRDAVISGQLSPGDRVVESEIARRIGVSQAPVREAVRQLAQEGLLTHYPRKGSFVAQIADADIASARQVREPIERLAATLAAAAISTEDAERLRAHVEEMRQAAREDNPSRFHEADIAFHSEVVAVAGNPLLTRVWETLVPTLRGLRVISDPLFAGDWNGLAREHSTILDVLIAGDPERAGRVFGDHAAGRRPSSSAS